jgi:predicted RNase H-like HicB family nuclease
VRNEFTAIVEPDGPWYIAYCAEVPGANGQGKSREECLANLREAIVLILSPSGPVSASAGGELA